MDGVRSCRGGPEPSFLCPTLQWHQHRWHSGKDWMGSHICPMVGWIRAGDMEDTPWRIVWDETPPGALQDNPLTQSSQPQGTLKIHVGSHTAHARGKGRDAPGSVPERTQILYGKLQLYRPWNMRFSIPSKIPVCFLVICGYSVIPVNNLQLPRAPCNSQ